MSLRFCPRCKLIMRPLRDGGMIVLKCLRCGYVEEANSVRITTTDLIKRGPLEMPVIVRDVETLPTTRKLCPRCNSEEAYFWIQQTRAADEPTTRFYKCVKCGHTWREYE